MFTLLYAMALFFCLLTLGGPTVCYGTVLLLAYAICAFCQCIVHICQAVAWTLRVATVLLNHPNHWCVICFLPHEIVTPSEIYDSGRGLVGCVVQWWNVDWQTFPVLRLTYS